MTFQTLPKELNRVTLRSYELNFLAGQSMASLRCVGICGIGLAKTRMATNIQTPTKRLLLILVTISVLTSV